MTTLPPPSPEIFKYLSYDKETGLFTWIKKSAVNTRIGGVAGHFNSDGYRRIGFRGVQYIAAKLAWYSVTGEWPPNIIDHINRDRTDDRWANLRLADHSLNMANTPKQGGLSSKFKGVTKVGNRWQAQICFNGNRRYLGLYKTELEAHAAYSAAALGAFGEFARVA
nr:MAG TPA: endonuclease [Caudoviricetes sp.]